MGTNGKICRKAVVAKEICVACGACMKVCPRAAITIWKGRFAETDHELCIGCGKCEKTCPAGCITIESAGVGDEK